MAKHQELAGQAPRRAFRRGTA